MRMTVQLEKGLPGLVGKDVNIKEMVIGKVTEYDIETGIATIDIDDESYSKIGWNPIAGPNIGISSRAKDEQNEFGNLIQDFVFNAIVNAPIMPDIKPIDEDELKDC